MKLWLLFPLVFVLAGWMTSRKMKAYKKHIKACKMRGIKHDESMWVPR